LKGLAAVGLIWDLKGVPKHILNSKNKKHAAELRKQYEAQNLRPPVSKGEKIKPAEEEIEA
jgi:stearoyl-CoA desaturase (delta-9 desaturase)